MTLHANAMDDSESLNNSEQFCRYIHTSIIYFKSLVHALGV